MGTRAKLEREREKKATRDEEPNQVHEELVSGLGWNGPLSNDDFERITATWLAISRRW